MHTKTELGNFPMTEVEVKVAIGLGWPKGHYSTSEGFAQMEGPVAQANLAGGIYLTNDVARIVQRRRRLLRKRTGLGSERLIGQSRP